jgi:hypothetical protein
LAEPPVAVCGTGCAAEDAGTPDSEDGAGGACCAAEFEAKLSIDNAPNASRLPLRAKKDLPNSIASL